MKLLQVDSDSPEVQTANTNMTASLMLQLQAAVMAQQSTSSNPQPQDILMDTLNANESVHRTLTPGNATWGRLWRSSCLHFMTKITHAIFVFEARPETTFSYKSPKVLK